jgi:hypothetical protein
MASKSTDRSSASRAPQPPTRLKPRGVPRGDLGELRHAQEPEVPNAAPGREALAERAESEAEAAERATTIDALARRNVDLARRGRGGAYGRTGRTVLMIAAAAAAALAAGWMVVSLAA